MELVEVDDGVKEWMISRYEACIVNEDTSMTENRWYLHGRTEEAAITLMYEFGLSYKRIEEIRLKA